MNIIMFVILLLEHSTMPERLPIENRQTLWRPHKFVPEPQQDGIKFFQPRRRQNDMNEKGIRYIRYFIQKNSRFGRLWPRLSFPPQQGRHPQMLWPPVCRNSFSCADWSIQDQACRLEQPVCGILHGQCL